MRILVIFLTVLMTLSCGASADWLVNNQGEVKQIETEKWRPATAQEMEALAHPGQEVPMVNDQASVYRRDGFWGIVLVKSYEQVLVYQDGRLQILNKSGEIKVEWGLSPRVVLFLLAIGLMAMSNVAYAKRSKNSTSLFPATFFIAYWLGLSLTIFVIAFAFVHPVSTATFAFVLAFAVFFFAVTSAYELGFSSSRRISYYSFSAVFYGLTVWALFA